MLRTAFSQMTGSSDLSNDTRRVTRLKPHKKWDNEGVASTVGTIMALMVFLAFLSMFTSQYVPVWMEENEASHMADAYGQFASLKQAIDMQVLVGTLQGTSTVSMFSPIKLGADGIPMFAAQTAGTLSIYRSLSYNNVSFCFGDGDSIINYTTNTGGTIKLYAGNRYYIPQELAYENDALIIKQSDGEYMKATPQFKVNQVGLYAYEISFTQIDLRGDDINYIGFGTRGIKTSMMSTYTTTYTNLTDVNATGDPTKYSNLFINQTTWYPDAWMTSLNQTLAGAGMAWGTNYTITSTKLPNTDPIDDLYLISVRIVPTIIMRFSLTVANVEVSTSETGAV
ncbi:MAG: hypothetical protein Q7J68_05660 [Thermoplasmata archaeon]|nr:hypothetical protein [Thermoplasmata archaeon]